MDPVPSATTPPLPPDALVGHAGFVRRLAFALLRNDADADDAAQETLARAIEKPAQRPPGGRPWLATVLRNVVRRRHRGLERNRRREAVAARRDLVAATDDVAARLDIVRPVIAAIERLDPPSREAVLLRHYEDLPPREIAARIGVPVATVKKRLERAHERLRAVLDERRGGNAEGWRSALGVLVGVDQPSGLSSLGSSAGGSLGSASSAGEIGGVAMATGTNVAIAVTAALLLVGGAWLVTTRGREAERTAESTAREAQPAIQPPPPPLAAQGAPSAAPVSPAAAPQVTEKRPVSYHSRGRVRFAFVEPWNERSESSWTLPEAGQWTRTTSDGASLSWGIVARDAAEKTAASLAGAAESASTIDARDARVRAGARSSDGATVRVLTLAPIDGREEPFAFVLTASAGASAASQAELDAVVASVRIAALPAAVAAAVGDVPGDVVEVAVFVDGVPTTGEAVARRWGNQIGDTAFGDDGSWQPMKGPPRSLPIGADGRVRFDALDAAHYEFRVTGPAIGEHMIFTDVPGRADRRHPRLVVTLGRGEISGRAFARDGSVAVGATVRGHSGMGAYGSLIGYAETRVDADGRYALRGLPSSPAAPFSVVVDVALLPLDGMPQALRRAHVHLAAGVTSATQDFGSTAPGAIWTGRVLDGNGAVVAGPGSLTLVLLDPHTGSEFEGGSIRKDGRLEARVRPGRYRVNGQVVRPDAAPRNVDAFEITIPPTGIERDVVVGGGSISLRVRVATGSPEGIGVYAEPVKTERSWSSGIFTGKSGAARIGGLPRGRYRLWVKDATVTLAGGGAPEVEVAEADVTVNLDVTPGAPAASGDERPK